MNKQSEILQLFKFDRELTLTKKEIVDQIDDYYWNGSKHIGDRLSRMVKCGLLVRVSKGKYKLGHGNRKNPQPIDKNQTKLF